MKTPEEIKKALKCQSISCDFCESQISCLDCEFYVSEYMSAQISADALNYIRQLENQIGELTEKAAQLEASQLKWINIMLSGPPKHDEPKPYLIAYKIDGKYVVDGAVFKTGFGFCWRDWIPRHVTHYMPVPLPPKE